MEAFMADEVRPLAAKTFRALVLDVWPEGPAALTDFGLKSQEHYAALQHLVKCYRCKVTEEGLDAAMCRGPLLTALCQNPCNPHPGIVFETPYDEFEEGR
jgi:hypothetical protein